MLADQVVAITTSEKKKCIYFTKDGKPEPDSKNSMENGHKGIKSRENRINLPKEESIISFT